METKGFPTSADIYLELDGKKIAVVQGYTARALLDFSGRPRDIDDPWYTGDFDTAWGDIEEGCEAFLSWLEKEKRL